MIVPTSNTHRYRAMLRAMQRTWVLVVILGCGGGSKQAATMPAPPAPTHTCEKAADHMLDMMPATEKSSPDNLKALKDEIVAHCTDDKWSADVITCIDGAAKPEDIGKCDELLTPAQRSSLAKDSDDAAPADAKKKAGPKKGGDPEEGGE
jgi:hypothetical protein